jgi:ATP phosphoribosyltransferase
VNKDAWSDPWKREKIENIAMLLQGTLNANRVVGLKMNVAGGNLDRIVEILPSLNAPTVASLYNQEWYSVETVVSEDIVRELIPRLKKLGAEGIIEYALNKII